MSIILLIFLVIFLIDFFPLKQDHPKKDLCVFLAIYFTAFILALLQNFKVKLPSMMNLLEYIVVALGLNY